MYYTKENENSYRCSAKSDDRPTDCLYTITTRQLSHPCNEKICLNVSVEMFENKNSLCFISLNHVSNDFGPLFPSQLKAPIA